ncbi:hypothetical protein ACOX9J_05845 [Enterococcus lactis]|uniref:hypothetical protein n=2 Tax=Enterococcus TaxID=1350 RepID=UPI0015D67F1C|nr:hypothetical protein [Enterococcus faecium]EMF0305075.1 hypothetical protein [Enterococcus faecium]
MTLTYFKNQVDREKKYVTEGDRSYYKKNGSYRWSEIKKRILRDYESVEKVSGTKGKNLKIILGPKIKNKLLNENTGSGAHNIKEYQSDAATVFWNYLVNCAVEFNNNKDDRVQSSVHYTPKHWLIKVGILENIYLKETKYKYESDHINYHDYDKRNSRYKYEDGAKKYEFLKFKERLINELFNSVKNRFEKLITINKLTIGFVTDLVSIKELYEEAFDNIFDNANHFLKTSTTDEMINRFISDSQDLSDESLKELYLIMNVNFEDSDIRDEELLLDSIRNYIGICMAVDEVHDFKPGKRNVTESEKIVSELNELQRKSNKSGDSWSDSKYKLALYNRAGVISTWYEYEINLNQVIQHKNKYRYLREGKEYSFPLDSDVKKLITDDLKLSWFKDFHFRNIKRTTAHILETIGKYEEKNGNIPSFYTNTLEYQMKKSGDMIPDFWYQDLEFCDFKDKIDPVPFRERLEEEDIIFLMPIYFNDPEKFYSITHYGILDSFNFDLEKPGLNDYNFLEEASKRTD